MVRLFVGGMHFDTDAEGMRRWFERKGFKVEGEPEVKRDRVTGHSRGFGFINLETMEAAEDIIAKLHGQDMNGRRVTVNKADPRPSRYENGPVPRLGEPRKAPGTRREPRGSDSDFNY